MCGITGYVGVDEYAAHQLQKATLELKHRGPNGVGFAAAVADRLEIWRDDEQMPCPPSAVAAFGHTRLSILDTSTRSDQPFRDRSGNRVVVYNGEIYNFVELREELTRLGHRFESTGDTEVLLAAYAEWGDRLTEHLVGMWAFAVLDLERRVVFFSRDRFGIKPLYYLVRNGALLFSSEIKGLRMLTSQPLEPNEKVVASFVVDGLSDTGDESFFRDVHRFPAGCSALLPLGRRISAVNPQRYWTIPSQRVDISAGEAADRFRSLLTTAVHEHLRSDVTTASCLSGGLDSSSIVSLAARDTKLDRARQPYFAFGYCPDDERVSERKFMERVATEAGIELVPVTPSPSHVTEALDRLLRHHDEPVGSASVLAQWLVFEAVRGGGATVALDGQGADEVLGGYHSYYLPRIADLARSGRVRDALTLYRACSADAPGAATRGGVAMALAPPALRTRIRRVRQQRSRDSERHPLRLLSPPLRAAYLDAASAEPTPANTFRAAREADLLETRLPALLRYEDTNSMAHSVESRVPFLDHRLVDFASQLPDDLLMSGSETKYVLRQAMRGIVPSEILDRRDKIGFRATPEWTSTLIADGANELTANRTDWESGWFDPAPTAALLSPGRSYDVATTEFLAWRVANVKLWLRGFS